MNEQKKWYRMIQNYAFALQETALYLDTHPNCRQALQYHQKIREKLLNAMRMYEEKFGQLTVYGSSSCDSWNWVTEAWPWESECRQRGE